MRAPVAVLVSRFPLITETFILRELIELERQGQPVRLVPLLRERPEVVHPEAESWVARALYTPFLSSAIVLSNIRALFRRPGEYLRLFFRVLVGSAGDANLFVGALGIFPKSVHLAERLAAENVAHVHAHFATHPTTAAYVISRLTGIPFSFTVHAHDIFVHRAMLAEKLRAAAFVRCISRFNETYLTEHYPDECAGKTQVVHVGVDLKSYVNGNPRAQNGETVLLTVAAFKPYKGHSTLVKACRLLNESGVSFRLALVGDGPLFQEISRQIEASGISPRIELLGNQAQQAVTEHLARATIFVLPSVVAPNGQMEGIPVALMEAMASGRPVIASSLSGVSELVEDGVHGLLVAPGDAEGLAEAIRRLGDHPELRRRMGERGRRKVEEEFELQTCVSELIELFGVRAVHQTRDSKVLEVRREKRGGALELVYKKHRSREGESRPPAERARREFQVLTELRRLDGGHRAVRPLFLDEQSAIIAMERCRGTKLDELLRRTRASLSPSHFDESERALYRAGSWLRAFQACTRGESNGAETAGQLLEESLGLVPRSQMRNGGLQIEIEALAGELIAHPRAACGHHGDFWPGNLFIDSETITAIDFEGYRQGLPLEDVAYFLLHLDMFSFQPRWWRRRRLTRAFLAGYLQGDPLDATQFRFCRLTKALQVLRTVPGRRQRRRLLRVCRHG